MKTLLAIAIAAMSFAALAQEPEAGPKGPRKHGPMAIERGQMHGGIMPKMGMEGGMMGDPAIMAAMNPRMAEKLGLSEDVQEKIKAIDLESRNTIKDLQQKAVAAMEKQAKLMKEAKPDEAAVMAAIDELFNIRKEMAKAQTKRVIAVKALLTPEQLEKAVEQMKNAREEFRKRRMDGQRAPHRDAKPEGDKPKADPPPPPQCETSNAEPPPPPPAEAPVAK